MGGADENIRWLRRTTSAVVAVDGEEVALAVQDGAVEGKIDEPAGEREMALGKRLLVGSARSCETGRRRRRQFEKFTVIPQGLLSRRNSKRRVRGAGF